MSLPHAQSGEIISLPLVEYLPTSKTTTLVKTADLEVIRLVLPAGKEIPLHRAPGEITVQCLEGHVLFTAHGKEQDLFAGQMSYLAASEPHALKAAEDSAVLVTILLGKR